jgi:hypothetical protein
MRQLRPTCPISSRRKSPSPPQGEREGPNAQHWEGEGERTVRAGLPFRPLPLTLALSPAGGEGIGNIARALAKDGLDFWKWR